MTCPKLLIFMIFFSVVTTAEAIEERTAYRVEATDCSGDMVALSGLSFDNNEIVDCLATIELLTGPDVTIASGANVIFTAPEIRLLPGTRIMSGASFIAKTDSGIYTDNHPPIASPLSISADPLIPYVEAQLIGTDPDQDTISYHLLSPATGLGYVEALLGPVSGRLYVTLDGSGSTVTLSFQVSDGMVFSEPANVTITSDVTGTDNGLGAETPDSTTYAGFLSLTPYGTLLGAPGGAPTLPDSVDLSASFPVPGQQGNQGSCVGWSSTYAIKSYFEKRDQGWLLNTPSHLFSPSFVFNQIALPGCDGSYIHQALQFLEATGAATLDRMPYTDLECSTSPSPAAMEQAPDFKISGWGILRTVDDVKSQLANHRPALLGISIYPAFHYLKGTDSVYTDYSGLREGGHAVAVVGYDEHRYGGAFRVINSWGTNWGDNGYFWLPYSAFGEGVVSEAYGLEDEENPVIPDTPVDPIPVGDNLPNLEVADWTSNHDPKPGGAGSLTYRVSNTGTATAAAGAYVNLMLSPNRTISDQDIFVIYEQIPFDLEPGHAAVRDEDNGLSFHFPDTLQDGLYYMALWVDDLDTVRESNEEDNLSFGDYQVDISNDLPDLAILSWNAVWDEWYGFGLFTYRVQNQGVVTAPGGWDINLMLSADGTLEDGDDSYLYYEDYPYDLPPDYLAYRDDNTAATFDITEIPAGAYYMAVWVDDLEEIQESNERNNISWGYAPATFSDELAAKPEPGASGPRHNQYNGQMLPQELELHSVEIITTAQGGKQLRFIDESGPRRGIIDRESLRPTKTLRAANPRIFPISTEIPMPSSE